MTQLAPEEAPKKCELHLTHEINCVRCVEYLRFTERAELARQVSEDIKRIFNEILANREKQSG